MTHILCLALISARLKILPLRFALLGVRHFKQLICSWAFTYQYSYSLVFHIAEDYAVADAGFLEGGFCYCVAREARPKFLKLHPLLIKTTSIFDRFREGILALPVNQSVFDRNFC